MTEEGVFPTAQDTVLRCALVCWLKDPTHGPTDAQRTLVVARLHVPTINGQTWRVPREYVRTSPKERQQLYAWLLTWADKAMPQAGIADLLRATWNMEVTYKTLFD